MDLALYRKYRPQIFADIIGQDHIVNILQKSLIDQKVHHAYLFIGSRGTGKTSTARILAKSLNCERRAKDPKIFEPCNTCSRCKGIMNSSYMDLIEIDAASNRGVDEIRDLREKIKLSPTEGEYKVYIVDEVHMLTNEAFNALLKTLEEPPPHAFFILCTTDPQKLPATIVSRCIKMEFHKPTLEQLGSKIKKVLKEEKVKISDSFVEEISRSAGGAFRDAEVVLEKVINEVADKEIDEEKLSQILGLGNKDSVIEFLSLVFASDGPKMLLWVDNFVTGGGDPRILNTNIMEYLRFLLLIKLGVGEDVVKKEISPDSYDFLATASKQLDKDRILKLINSFTQSLENIKNSPIPVLPLEVAIAELMVEPIGVSLEIDKEKKPTAEAKKQEKVLETEKTKSGTEPKEETKKEAPTQEKIVSKVIKEAESEKDEEPKVANLVSGDIESKWLEAVKEVKTLNNSLHAVLTGCVIKEYDGKILTIAFPYGFHKDRFDEPKNRKLFERIIADKMDNSVRIVSVLGEKKKRNMGVGDIKNVEPVSDNELVEGALDFFNTALEG